MKRDNARRTFISFPTAGHWQYLKSVKLMIELDPPNKPYRHWNTEPLEADREELLDSRYSRQN